MIVMRANYDKAHRCPVESGPAMRSARNPNWCSGGYVVTKGNEHPMEKTLRWGRCKSCGCRTLPMVTRLVDPAWLRHVVFPRLSRAVRYAIDEFRYKHGIGG